MELLLELLSAIDHMGTVDISEAPNAYVVLVKMNK